MVNIRDFAEGKHKKVDDRPYGGGPGMVLMPEPVTKAIRSVKSEKSHKIYLTPQGKPLTANRCKELSKNSHLVILCGHYEGIDERAIESEIDEEISIGDYVLTSGAPAAIVLIDSISRFVPGVVGNEKAPNQDSFENGIFDVPLYTRPSVFETKSVPSILCEGHHAKIAEWKEKQAKKKTKRVRPELCKLGDF